MRLLIARHGATQYNLDARFTGEEAETSQVL